MALTKIKTGSVSDSITLTTPDINGGTIDATLIGGTTPAAISGTTGTDAAGNVRSGRKNLIINGGVTISQRGDYTTASTMVHNGVSVDRWKGAFANITVNKQQTSVTIGGVAKKALKSIATSTSSAGYMGNYQGVELSAFQIGSTYTISAWVRSNNSNARLRVNGFGNIGSANAPTSHSGGGDWEKLTWTLSSTGMNNYASLWVILYSDAGNVQVTSGDYIEVADYQLEVGSVATEFEHRSYGEELLLCKRYYEKCSVEMDYTGDSSAVYMYRSYTIPVEKRVAPTIAVTSSIQYWSNGTPTTISGSNLGLVTTNKYWQVKALAVSAARGIYGGEVSLDAEL
jgi:hypothetical protein